MSLWQNVSLVLVGLLWGATNPFIRQGTVGVDKITADSKFKKTLLEWKFLITRWQYIVPFLLNQSGSILYFYALQNADLSLAVPVANSCTFLFTAFTAILLGEQKQNFKTYIGIGLITTGISIFLNDCSECTNDKMINVLHRPSLRGLVKCKECHHYNGTRALACKNPNCSLSNAKKRKRKTTLDTIRLVTKTDTNLYSVQIRERDPNQRDFVSITDKIISSDDSGSIISRNAICYIDTCKYDSNDVNISCKHVKCSVELTEKEASPVVIEVSALNSLRISEDLKKTLWNLYTESESTIPMVQRINRNMFVVKCDVSLAFPAGLLHVIFNMQHSDSKESSYMCSCKAVKCEHFLLVFAGLLSSSLLGAEFKRHIGFFSDLVGSRRNLLAEVKVDASSEIIKSENASTEALDNVLVSSDPMESTAAVIDDLENIELIQIPSTSINDSVIFEEDINAKNDLTDSIESIELQTEIAAMEMDSIRIVNEDANIQNLELIDCQIELMDQFKLTDHIELCNDEIQLQEDDDYLRVENICDIPDLFNFYPNTIMVEDELSVSERTKLPDVNPAIAKRRKVAHKSKRNIQAAVISELDDKGNAPGEDVSERFSSWLDSVIETINGMMEYSGNGCPDPLVFRIPHTFFDHLRQRFTVGSRKRLPSHIKALQKGKYKDLMMFCWKFTNVNLLKTIFKTEKMFLQVEKSYEEVDGVFTSTTTSTSESNESAFKSKNTYRKIRPTDYRTFLKIRASQNGRRISDDRDGEFIIEWIPFVLKASKYGDMIVKFQYGHMKNGKVVITGAQPNYSLDENEIKEK